MQRTACHLPGLRMFFKTGKRDFHTHKRTMKILLPFASNAKAHLCSFASNTNTLQTHSFFSHFLFFIFGSDTGSATPAFKETNCSLRVPFSRFLPLQKGPTVPKNKKTNLLVYIQRYNCARQPFGSPRCSSLTALYIHSEAGPCIWPFLQLELGL